MPSNTHEGVHEGVGEALAGFAHGGPLREGATALFGALGYRSDRVADAGGVAQFLERHAADEKLTDPQRKLIREWRAVEIVFQITDEEIRGQGQGRLFADDGLDSSRIQSFLFLAADIADGVYNRTQLAETTRAVNRLFAMPVLVLFRYGGYATLAVVHRRPHKGDKSRDVLEKVTLVKDIHLLEPHRAHIDILAELALPKLMADAQARSFDDLHRAWENALDADALNKRFYRELFAWFERAVEACRFPDDGAGEGSGERHVIRLITRLLFIWFLKEKGLVPEDLFKEDFAANALKDHDLDSTDYYRAVLQNLFFATLNTEVSKRSFSRKARSTHRDFSRYRYRSLLAQPDAFLEKLKTVPFVNGGLFDCLDDFESESEGGKRIDAFTDNINTHGKDLHVPAQAFLDESDGLFPLFRRYKFTVEENTPLDREVALDPELLGHVFENLLAAYNPETRQTARKATGSYYTPRRIVDYMVDEALVAALASRAQPTDGDLDYWRDRLRYLLDYEDAFDDAGELFEGEETEAVVRAIAGLRVLDPAAGSGAFPMGVLHKLTLALRRLDPDNTHWEHLQRELAGNRARAAFEGKEKPARDAELQDISDIFETYRDSDYGRKLYLMQNGIFGVDIQPIACQIAKLRFFISLTVEQRANNDQAGNYGIRPLPNLETRFVAANALIGLMPNKPLTRSRPGKRQEEPSKTPQRNSPEMQMVLRDDVVQTTMDRLARVRERYFNARSRDIKRSLRAEDKALCAKLAQELEREGFHYADAQNVADWQPYDQGASAAWFDPQWMFGVMDGFDLVIGNPPYVRADFQDDRHKHTREVIKASGDYATLWEKWDLFLAFMERGFKLLREGGVTSLIVSDAFGHAKYALKAREWFLRNARVDRIDFYSNIKIFDAAVRNLSYLFQKADGAENKPLRRLHESDFGDITSLSTDRQRELGERAFFPQDLYRPPPSPTIPLVDICYISKGMVVHANERTARGSFALEDVVSSTKDKRHPKPFLQGKDLTRWLPTRHRWLEWGTNRAPALFSRPTFVEIYDSKEKLLSIDMSASETRPRVVFDNQQLYHNHSVWSFVPWHELKGVTNRSLQKQARYPGERGRTKYAHREKLEENSRRFQIKFLLGVMNSTSAQDFLRAHRRSNVHLYPDDWKKLPIPDVPANAQQPIVDLVDKVLAEKKADADANVTTLEQEIDTLVRKLYGFGQ